MPIDRRRHEFKKKLVLPCQSYINTHPSIQWLRLQFWIRNSSHTTSKYQYDIEGAFYEGQIHVGIKENCFQPSSLIRHVTELSKILENRSMNLEILCLYTDGGPMGVTFFSVQMVLVCLFLHHDKDILIAFRTPVNNSWEKNRKYNLLVFCTKSVLNIFLKKLIQNLQWKIYAV